MKLNKNYLKISLGLLLIVFLVTGCSLQGSLSLTVIPNPIEFTFADQSVDTTLKVTTVGFGQITIDDIIILVLDGEEEISNDVIEVNETIDFSVPGVSHEEKYLLDLSDLYDQEITQEFYDDNLRGKNLTLKITITGSKTTITKVPIEFN
jgi:hypothetical protein